MKKELNKIEGTVAYVMSEKINDINFNTSLNDVKMQVITILRSPQIRQKEAAERFIKDVERMRNLPQLLSTLGTYATGLKC